MLLGFRSLCTTYKQYANHSTRINLNSANVFQMFRWRYRMFLPLGHVGTQQSLWWCGAQRWPLSPKKTSVWGFYPVVLHLSSALWPDTPNALHHTPINKHRQKMGQPRHATEVSVPYYHLLQTRKSYSRLSGWWCLDVVRIAAVSQPPPLDPSCPYL